MVVLKVLSLGSTLEVKLENYLAVEMDVLQVVSMVASLAVKRVAKLVLMKDEKKAAKKVFLTVELLDDTMV